MKKKAAGLLGGVLALTMLISACQPAAVREESSLPQASADTLPAVVEGKVKDVVAEGDFVLAEDGVAVAKIVLPDDSQLKERVAANDLQTMLGKITGAEFPLIVESEMEEEGFYVLVGLTDKAKELTGCAFASYPADERFLLQRQGNYLILCGNDDGNFCCTRYAVTRLLEEAGCGFFGTDELWEIIPQKKTLAIDSLFVEETARFSARVMGGVNGNLGLRWMLGGEKIITGHGIPWFVSRESHYETNPEYFALVEGSRDPYRFEYWQYCYTNDDFAAAVAEGLIRYFEGNPTLVSFPLAANDGWEKNWCECEKCESMGNDSDTVLYFANNVARRVKEVFPDKEISILSYHTTFFPPTQVQAEENVEVMFCTETTPTLPLAEGSLLHKGYNSITHNTYTQSWKDNFAQYISDAGVKNKAIWCWYCISGAVPAWKNSPWVQGQTALDNQALWEAAGVTRVFYDCGGGDEQSLRWPLYYVAAKGMWQECDANSLLYNACLKLYGAAAEDMFRYYCLLAEASASCDDPEGMTWVMPSVRVLYANHYDKLNEITRKLLDMCDSLSQEEEARVRDQMKYWGFARTQV